MRRSESLNILAIDTATEACSAALLREDGEVFAEFEIAPRQHTRLLPKMMGAVLAAANCSRTAISHCAFSNGPGAFTGIRIAASTAQGIAIALNIPLLPISTLATLAQVSLDRQKGTTTMVALDARMNEVYWALYRLEDGLAVLEGEESLNRIEDVKLPIVPKTAAGHGWTVGRPVWAEWLKGNQVDIDEHLLPDATALLKLAKQAVINNQQVEADKVSINYLRNQVAEKSKKA